MPTYEYKCTACGLRFERRQGMTEAPVAQCPECQGKVERLVSGGAGFIIKRRGRDGGERRGEACSFEESGTTCCGRDERCGKPACGDDG